MRLLVFLITIIMLSTGSQLSYALVAQDIKAALKDKNIKTDEKKTNVQKKLKNKKKTHKPKEELNQPLDEKPLEQMPPEIIENPEVNKLPDEPVEKPPRKCFKLWGKTCFFGD